MEKVSLPAIFTIIELYGNKAFTQDPNYTSCKSKILSGMFNDITKKEYQHFVGAIKTAESKYHKMDVEDIAYLLRQLLYHADQLGYPEIAALKKKYKWSFI